MSGLVDQAPFLIYRVRAVGVFVNSMITLNRKVSRCGSDGETTTTGGVGSSCRISVRDKLLVKEVVEMQTTLPSTCTVRFPDPDTLSEFTLTVAPDEGHWRGGHFHFTVSVTEDYNMAPPKVKCVTKLWHPNINEDGEICLSLLRQNSIDGLGWAPTRKLKDVVWGLNSLFTDLLNFEDPLNIEAAEQYQKDRFEFREKVKEYINAYSKR